MATTLFTFVYHFCDTFSHCQRDKDWRQSGKLAKTSFRQRSLGGSTSAGTCS